MLIFLLLIRLYFKNIITPIKWLHMKNNLAHLEVTSTNPELRTNEIIFNKIYKFRVWKTFLNNLLFQLLTISKAYVKTKASVIVLKFCLQYHALQNILYWK